MSFIALKLGGKLAFKDLGGYESRNPSTIWTLTQADAKYNFPDFPPLKVHTDDFEKSPQDYTYSKQNSYTHLVPDFNFHAWPQIGVSDYEEECAKLCAAGTTPPAKQCVGWIGSLQTHPNRSILHAIGQANPELFEIIPMGWSAPQEAGTQKLAATRYLTLEELARTYAVLIDIEGRGFSARVKYLLHSGRPLLLVDRPHKEFYYEKMEPWVHYIPVERNMSDLVERARWCLDNYEKACEIGRAGQRYAATYASRDACYAQWDKLIREHIAEKLKK